ncbi:MAG: short chain dehydrogenase [Solirubrobacteraceae bacterium]|nr:short chain dehydrogenase [Solirubrobacteraceae bacterium]
MVITGGSSGIGRAAAVAFARRGSRLVLAARDERLGAPEDALGDLGGSSTGGTGRTERPESGNVLRSVGSHEVSGG